MTSVIKRSIEFNVVANIEIAQAAKEQRELRNIYSLDVPKNWPQGPDSPEQGKESRSQEEKSPPEVIEAAFKEAMEERTSAYDSHPAPQKRFAWVKRLKITGEKTDDGKTAWELLENPQSLEESMTKELFENVKQWRVMEAMAEAEYEDQ